MWISCGISAPELQMEQYMLANQVLPPSEALAKASYNVCLGIQY